MIFHLALASDWAAAQQTGQYQISTLGRTLDDEGFIHASADLAQARRVATRYYQDVREPLLLLTIDEAKVSAPVIREAPDGAAGEVFPHIYGPLPVAAVTSVTPYAI